MKKKLLCINCLLSLIYLLIWITNLQADVTWEQVNVYGGQGKCMAISPVNPSLIYVGVAFRRLFKSEDGAATWTQTESNAGGPYCVVTHPTNVNIAFQGTGNGIWKTENGGKTWRRRLDTYPHIITALAIHPVNPDILYAAKIDGNNNSYVYRSHDNGENWELLGSPFPENATIQTLCVDKRSYVFAGFTKGGYHSYSNEGELYYSMNNGTAWQTVADVSGKAIKKVIYDLGTDRMYLTTQDDGVYRGTDNGANWDRITTKNMYAITVDPNDSNVLYGASGINQSPYKVYKDINYGEGGWNTTISTPEAGIEEAYVSIVIDPTDSNIMYILEGSEDALYKSTDAGKTWTKSVYGLTGLSVVHGIKDQNSDRVYICGTEHIYYSDDDGDTWTWLHQGGALTSGSLTLHPTDSKVMFLKSAGVLSKSTDTGKSFTEVASYMDDPDGYQPGKDIIFRTDNPDIIYMGKYVNYEQTEVPGYHLYKSIDCGMTFNTMTAVETCSIRSIAIHPTNPDILFLSSGELGDDDTHLAPGGGEGIYISNDGGKIWRNVGIIDEDGCGLCAERILIDTETPNVMYIVSYNEGSSSKQLWKSTDGGDSWVRLRPTVDGGEYSEGIVDIKYRSPSLYVATGSSVLVSDDQGETWVYLKSGQGIHSIFAGSIYMSDEEGLWKYNYVPGSSFRSTLRNVIVFPNPYRPGSGTIYDNPPLFGKGIVFSGLTAKADIKIFNIAGELISELHKTGQYGRYLWDTRNEKGKEIASGVYIYLITNPDNSSQKARGRFAIIR